MTCETRNLPENELLRLALDTQGRFTALDREVTVANHYTHCTREMRLALSLPSSPDNRSPTGDTQQCNQN